MVSRNELLAAVWNGRIVSAATLTNRINAARATIGDNGRDQRLIRTVVRSGVRFVGAVDEQGITATAGMSAGPAPSYALPRKPSIAVLPFTNVSGDPEQDYFAAGMADEIITGLSRIKWLFVIGRNSTFAYKGKSAHVTQVGRELGVRYVLEAGVRKSKGRIHITAQILDAGTGIHLWAETYDRQFDDIFALQDELTMSVAAAIEPTLRKAEVQRARRKRPESLNAYDLVLRALPFVHGMMEQDASPATQLLERALELESNYAGAHALLAWCIHIRLEGGELSEQDRTVALRHAHEAIAGGCDDATALAISGHVICFREHDTTTALNLFAQALSLSNSDVFALCCSAIAYAWMGKAELAIDLAKRALRLGPFDPINYLSYDALAITYFYVGRYEEALESLQDSARLNPRFNSGISHALTAATLLRLGHICDAKAEARRVLELEPTFSIQKRRVADGFVADVFRPFAEAWREAGLPEE
jgi:TolB-like protein/Flp pilus assembly protein TadD